MAVLPLRAQVEDIVFVAAVPGPAAPMVRVMFKFTLAVCVYRERDD